MERSMTPRLSTLVYCTFEGQVLLLDRQTSPYRGFLLPPGGKCEFGEIPIACARREFAEETGYTITEDLRPRGVVYDYCTSPDWNWLIFVYSFEASQRPHLVQEKHPLIWVDLENLDDYKIPEADHLLMAHLFDEQCSYLELAMQYHQAEKFAHCTARFEGGGGLFTQSPVPRRPS